MEGDTAAVSGGNERGGRGWEVVEAETDAAGNLLEQARIAHREALPLTL